MKTRKERWLEKGYTPEQIENHLQFERLKSKQARERRIRNNESNKEILATIKKDILDITFNFGNLACTVIKISPTTDGTGFWFKCRKDFKDGSSGEFRQYAGFDDYNKDFFIRDLRF